MNKERPLMHLSQRNTLSGFYYTQFNLFFFFTIMALIAAEALLI